MTSTQQPSTKPHIPLSVLRTIWLQAWFYCANNGRSPSDVFRGYVADEVGRRIIAALRQQLASAQAGTWQPLLDGDVLPEKFGERNFQISGNGSEFVMSAEGTVIWADLPPDYRLCHLQPAAPEQAG